MQFKTEPVTAMIPSRLRFLLLALPLFLLSCDSNDDENGNGGPQAGTFQVTVTGDVTDSFNGQALWARGVDEEGQEFFLIQMLTGTAAAGQTVVTFTSGDRPPTGQYPFLDFESMEGEDLPEGEYVGLVSTFGDAGGYVLISIEGGINITTSTDARVAGTFNFSAAGFTLGQGEETMPLEGNVEGEFNAVFSPIQYEVPEL